MVIFVVIKKIIMEATTEKMILEYSEEQQWVRSMYDVQGIEENSYGFRTLFKSDGDASDHYGDFLEEFLEVNGSLSLKQAEILIKVLDEFKFRNPKRK
jgi:hypothetical protein